jgi:hypothetical protein
MCDHGGLQGASQELVLVDVYPIACLEDVRRHRSFWVPRLTKTKQLGSFRIPPGGPDPVPLQRVVQAMKEDGFDLRVTCQIEVHITKLSSDIQRTRDIRRSGSSQGCWWG